MRVRGREWPICYNHPHGNANGPYYCHSAQLAGGFFEFSGRHPFHAGQPPQGQLAGTQPAKVRRLALLWTLGYPGIYVDRVRFFYNHRSGYPPAHSRPSHSDSFAYLDSYGNPIGNKNQFTRSHQHIHPNGHTYHYPHACAKRDQYTGANLDPAPDRYPLGHLDGEPDPDQNVNPNSHPCPSGDLHLDAHLDTQPKRYQVALSIAHKYQIKKCAK